MWRDENGFKHNGPSPYVQRKIEEQRSQMTFEEKYKEKIEEACRWLNNFLYSDSDNEIIRVHPLAYKTKKEIINNCKETYGDEIAIKYKDASTKEILAPWIDDCVLDIDESAKKIIFSTQFLKSLCPEKDS